jgi:hypothetical protein
MVSCPHEVHIRLIICKLQPFGNPEIDVYHLIGAQLTRNLLVLGIDSADQQIISKTSTYTVNLHRKYGNNVVLIVVVWCRDMNRRTRRSGRTRTKVVNVKQWM